MVDRKVISGVMFATVRFAPVRPPGAAEGVCAGGRAVAGVVRGAVCCGAAARRDQYV